MKHVKDITQMLGLTWNNEENASERFLISNDKNNAFKNAIYAHLKEEGYSIMNICTVNEDEKVTEKFYLCDYCLDEDEVK